MKTKRESAVSPVVGVMLMLVVVIIIAAVVSAFAGGTVSSQKKVPQASITGKFSISEGMRIIHDGGEPLAASETVFIIRDGSTFGQNLEQKTAQVLNKTLITDSKGNLLDLGTGSSNVTSFAVGDTLYISSANTTCSTLQPGIAAASSIYCISNADNVGKVFSLEVSDNKGNLISKSDVIISP
jgi:archaeal type IV pilus assembly protein PilA